MQLLLKISVTLLLIIFLASCRDTPIEEENIYGTWELVSLSYAGSTVLTDEADAPRSTFTGKATESNYTIEFKEDGTHEYSGTYTIELESSSGNIETSTTTLHSGNGEGTFTIDGDSFLVFNASLVRDLTTTSTGIEGFTIDVLTENSFEYSLTESFTTLGPFGEGETNFTSYQVVFSK